MSEPLDLSERVHVQPKDKASKNKVSSLHEPYVASIAKGKTHKLYELDRKVSVVPILCDAWILGVQSFEGNPCDGFTLKEVIGNKDCAHACPYRLCRQGLSRQYSLDRPCLGYPVGATTSLHSIRPTSQTTTSPRDRPP